MALTPEIQTPQAGVIAAIRAAASELRIPQANVSVVYNIPSPEIRVTNALVQTIQSKPSPGLRTTQGFTLAIVSGLIESPKIKAWGFTLDGHDIYVLKLGTGNKTLTFDLSTGQWSWWCSGDRPTWRASTGMNWRSPGTIPEDFGSNVLVGDDSSGVLWVLDPEFGVDDTYVDGTTRAFDRVATAQLTEVGHTRSPVYSVYLRGSTGVPVSTVNSITLEYSDNRGKTYVVADEPQTTTFGEYSQELVWRSLGQMRAPGRLFRISDNGSVPRLDSLDLNEE